MNDPFSPEQLISNPLAAVEFVFEKAVSSNPDAALKNFDCGEADFFNSFLDNGGLQKVPLLNSTTIRTLQPNTLVRFRGMIQDRPGYEFFEGVCKDGDVWRTNKYSDVARYTTDDPLAEVHSWRRWLIYCIPVPGHNDWIEPSGSYMHMKTFGSRKRQRDEDTVMEDGNEQDYLKDLSFLAEELPCPKRKRAGDIASSSSSLRSVPAEGIFSMTMVPSEVDIESLSCLVKIYHFPEPDLKINDVVDFVGILSFDQENPIGNVIKVPRLHCLVHRKLLLGDFVPGLLPLEPTPDVVKPIRKAILVHMATVLGNDDLATQFMLLHLLSSICSRNHNVPQGKLALNLTSLAADNISVFKDRILSMLKNLLPFTHDLRLTVELLNTGPLAPKKNKETKRLVSGALQLVNGSHLTLDETQLNVESLNSIGIDNIRVLKSLLEWQQVHYNVLDDTMEVLPDVQLLSFSEGPSKILPADLVLPIQPLSVGLPEILNADTLAVWRWYFATIRTLTLSVDESMLMTVLKNDMEVSRQNDPTLDEQHFMRMIAMARLVCVSFGETSLAEEHWQMANQLERRRRLRIQSKMP